VTTAEQNQNLWNQVTAEMENFEKDIIRACMVGSMMALVSPPDFAEALQRSLKYRIGHPHQEIEGVAI